MRLANLFDDFSLLEWGNISIPKSDMLKLNISIEMLAATLPSGTKSLRFFGRIATQTKPYYVVEGWSHDDTDQDTDTTPTTQEGRNGTNKYTYWVTTVTAAKPSDWIKLPSLTCTQIVQTRQMKRLLSGDLDATVITYPPFPGVEKHYLRAWIADIAGATVISPDGFYELDESDETGIQIKKAENYAMKPASDLLSPELWKHHELTPNSIGRVTKLPESTDENTDEKKEISEEGEDEDVAVPAPLSTVLSDDWIFRTYKGNKSITVARSRQWPGAVSVVSGTR